MIVVEKNAIEKEEVKISFQILWMLQVCSRCSVSQVDTLLSWYRWENGVNNITTAYMYVIGNTHLM